jgi:hypothetical protein
MSIRQFLVYAEKHNGLTLRVMASSFGWAMPDVVDLIGNKRANLLALTKVWLRTKKRSYFGSDKEARLRTCVWRIWVRND